MTKVHRVKIETAPDGRGRVTCLAFWMADYHPGHPEGEYRTAERAQVFFLPLQDIATRWPGAEVAR